MITTQSESLRTQGRDDCIDITDRVQEAVTTAKLRQGIATVFVTGSTAGVTTIEYEPGLVKDLKEAVRRLFPENLRYAHHESGGDDNGFSHLRASFIGPSLTVPIVDGKLALGTWQQIVLIDFDVRPRSRSFVIQLLGE
ncbi:MAG: YjbQ family protein [Candidatus Omnitrophica bacterium]|nr:YjbQ family protein [Candidatus Omnitrophota bacterium]